MLQQQQEQSRQFEILSRRVLTLFGPGHFYCLKVQGVFRDPLKSHTGKNVWFPIYVHNMVFGCLFNVLHETRKRNNFQFLRYIKRFLQIYVMIVYLVS